MDLSGDDVQDILKLLDDLPFGEMRLQTSRFSLVLRRAPDGQWTQETRILSESTVLPAAPGPAGTEAGEAGQTAGEAGQTAGDGEQTPGQSGPRTAAASAGEAGGDDQARESDGLVAVRTPLPGTFYRAPRPGAPPFVEVGSRVEPDTVVAIVETMKLMNSVSAGVTGTVTRILLDNAGPAERDATLMLIREQR